MELPVSLQAAQAAFSLLAGAALGLGFDLCRALRSLPGGKLLRGALDAAFCLAAGFFVFVFALERGEGRLRGFMLCCMGAGWGVYLLTLSPPLLAFLRRLVKSLGKLLSKAGEKLGTIRKIKKIEKKYLFKTPPWVYNDTNQAARRTRRENRRENAP